MAAGVFLTRIGPSAFLRSLRALCGEEVALGELEVTASRCELPPPPHTSEDFPLAQGSHGPDW